MVAAEAEPIGARHRTIVLGEDIRLPFLASLESADAAKLKELLHNTTPQPAHVAILVPGFDALTGEAKAIGRVLDRLYVPFDPLDFNPTS